VTKAEARNKINSLYVQIGDAKTCEEIEKLDLKVQVLVDRLNNPEGIDAPLSMYKMGYTVADYEKSLAR
jgi:hypothetical protein